MVEYMLGLKETTRQGTGLKALWFQTGISSQCRPRGKTFSFTGISLMSTMCFCSNRKIPTAATSSCSIHLAILPG